MIKKDLLCTGFKGHIKATASGLFATIVGHPFAAKTYEMMAYELPYDDFKDLSHDQIIQVTAPASVVEKMLALMASIPMTLGHRFMFNNRQNFNDPDYGGCGVGDSEPVMDGEKIRQGFTLLDDASIASVALKQTIELSLGFFFEIKKTGDRSAEFTDIWPDHVALVESGRGGSDLSLIANFSSLNPKRESETLMKIKIGEAEFDVDDGLATAITQQNAQFQQLKVDYEKLKSFDVDAAVKAEADFSQLLTAINPAFVYDFKQDKAEALFSCLKVAYPDISIMKDQPLAYYQGMASMVSGSSGTVFTQKPGIKPLAVGEGLSAIEAFQAKFDGGSDQQSGGVA